MILNFNDVYNRANWINFLSQNFLPEDFDNIPEQVKTEFKAKYINKNVTYFGISKSLNLKVYEMHHKSENDPRIGLSRDAFKFIDHQKVKNALILFIYENSNNYRFSLITREIKLDGKKVTTDFTNPKRFSYFIGPEAKTHTIEQYLVKKGRIKDEDDLKSRFSVEIVNKEFYEKIAKWYFWTVGEVKFPKQAEEEKNGRNIAVIRLLTRVIFIWFMKKQKLVPNILFDEKKLNDILKDISPQKTTYYKAIMQNLFFATLNTKIEKRIFRFYNPFQGKDKEYMKHNVYRYETYFKDKKDMLRIFKDIPFLNGGLFYCLDKSSKENNNEGEVRIDGFTRKEVGLKFPNFLFFSDETNIDLSKELGVKYKDAKVEGLINILSLYNFTIDENTTIDKELALDPELLGRVFENLLASFVPETSTTARKATGSYYTPREIVNYMVEESLKEYFKTHLENVEDLNEKLDILFDDEQERNSFNPINSERIVKLINSLKIVDPAVGSGAFPMGILNKLVFLLGKLDPKNKMWKQTQINALKNSTIDFIIKQRLIEQIEKHFKEKSPDYERKLHLIQKCIYGVDIQQIAVEITKLRFFISLLVDENIDKNKNNWNVKPLPNLDFKIMQGNSLISEFMGINFDEDENKNNGFLSFEDEVDQLIKLFQEKKNEFQNESDKRKKDKLTNEIEDLIIKIFETKLQKQKANYFSQLKSIENKYSALPNEKHRNEMITIEKHDLYNQTGFNLEEVEKQLREFTSGNKTKPFFIWKLYFAEVFQ
ncbi:MAG: hypothetical protein PF551_05775, partial [Candidatus Marinimicrobia bacterium]|nr:hypothetical protein [Candidatus Neomarinimicrobiota bacterium]